MGSRVRPFFWSIFPKGFKRDLIWKWIRNSPSDFECVWRYSNQVQNSPNLAEKILSRDQNWTWVLQSRFHGLRRTGGEWLNNSFSRNCFVINILSHDPSRVSSLSHDHVTCWSHRVTWSCRGHPSTFWRTWYIINNYKQDYVPIVKKYASKISPV